MFEINSDGIKECSYDEIYNNNNSALANGNHNEIVDISSVKICKTIRNMARVNTIKISLENCSNQNVGDLIDYLELCGVDLESYISEYLRNLQPYMIEWNENEDYPDDIYFIINKQHKISICIKLEKATDDAMQSLVVSFCEDYRYPHENSQIFVPVFADSIRCVNQTNNSAFINIYVQRGLLSVKLTVKSELRCQDVYIVRKDDIERELLDYCNTYIEDLYSSNLEIDFSQIDIFSMLQQVSFTGYGKDSFSAFSILIDSFYIQNDPYSKKAADFALTTYAKNLKLGKKDREELLEQLSEKYKNAGHGDIDILIKRIKTNYSS